MSIAVSSRSPVTERKSGMASVVKFDDEPHEIGDGEVSPTAIAVIERLTQYVILVN